MAKTFKKPLNFVILAALLSICILACIYYASPMKIQRIKAAYAGYSSIEELSEYSDMVIIATPLKEFEECPPTIKYNPDGRIEDEYTVSPFGVKKVIKGDSQLKSADILQPAAIIENALGKKVLRITGDYYTVMKKGESYLLFLKKVEEEGFYSVVSLEYGKYNLDGGDQDEMSITEKSGKFKKVKDMAKARFKKTFDSIQ
ncbi:hypothetical protein DFR58_11434 [Anaerobacterium chartisolvens]|uniref:Uncharacterized protein n=1 Tax=Anaerobacterium chartisolvens TaxID=1297424 RepID=A0A369AZD8_9FIRM|nr:hypothetical protein [Anaerobacterium chartisolvens]RCX14800.1 hypothetical protein DFR58_11434 [Anaerobacterium chartisolvens]